MGDDHAAGATGVQHRSELTSQSQPHLHIQTGKGLIQEHNPWSWGQGSRQGQPLTLTTGQLVRIALLQSMQPQQLKQPGHPLRVGVPLGQTKTGVLPGIQMRKQRIVLKDHANTPAFWLHPCPFPSHGALGQLHRAPLRAFKASNQAQQGGFTATGGAE